MTNALALNTENTADTILNVLTQTAQTQENNATNDISANANFNNVLNNLNSKTKSAQSNLEKSVLKTNTSSINKEAINTKDTSKKNIKTPNKNQDTTQTQTCVQTQSSQNVKKECNVENKKTSSEPIKTDVSASQETVKLEAKKENTENNNSSFPSPSPVFSSSATEIVNNEEQVISEEEVIIQIEELLGSIAITQDIELDINSDLLSEIKDKISQVASIDEIKATVEEITNYLNNSDLNNQNKETLFNELKEIQELINNTNIENVDFKNVLSELKTKLTETIKNTLFDITKQVKAHDIKINNEQLNINLEKIENITQDTTKEIFNEIKPIIEDLKEKLENIDSNISDEEIINSNNEEIKDLNKEIEKLISKIENKETIDSSEVNNLKNLLKNVLNEVSKDTQNETVEPKIEINNFEKIEISENTKETIVKTVEKLDEIFTNNETAEKEVENLSEILEIFENISTEDIELNDDIKTEIKEVISKINESIDTLDVSEIQEQSANIVSQLKTFIQKEDNEDENLNTDTSTISNVDSENSSTQQVEFEIPKDINIDKQAKTDEVKIENQDKQALEENIEINIEETNDDFIVKLDKAEITSSKTENLDKESFIQNTLQDMLIDIDYEAPSIKANTLTVSDELMKMAIDEPTSLNIDTSFKGSVVYDPASNNASVIKNINLAKTVQTSQNFELEQSNVLNQITDKMQQMKDGAGQKLTMVLRPNDLGRLSIELSTNHLGLTTNILAQNEDVRNYIERNIHALKQQLSEAGINVNTIQIKTAGQEGTSTYEGNQHFNQQQNENSSQNENPKQHQEQQQAKQEYITSLGGFEFQEAKDFSSILNKTMNYSLN